LLGMTEAVTYLHTLTIEKREFLEKIPDVHKVIYMLSIYIYSFMETANSPATQTAALLNTEKAESNKTM